MYTPLHMVKANFDRNHKNFFENIKRLIRSKSQDLETLPPQKSPVKKEKARKSPTSNRLLFNQSQYTNDHSQSSPKLISNFDEKIHQESLNQEGLDSEFKTFTQENWDVLASNSDLSHSALKNKQYHNYFLSILNNKTFPNSYTRNHKVRVQKQTKAAEVIQSWYRKRLSGKANMVEGAHFERKTNSSSRANDSMVREYESIRDKSHFSEEKRISSPFPSGGRSTKDKISERDSQSSLIERIKQNNDSVGSIRRMLRDNKLPFPDGKAVDEPFSSAVPEFSSGEVLKNEKPAVDKPYPQETDEEDYKSVQKLKIDLKIAQRTIELMNQENEALRRELDEQKLTIKTKIEEGLIQQKEQIKLVIDQYKSFIDKLMQDKKELSRKLEEAIEQKPEISSSRPESDRRSYDRKQEEYKAHVNSLSSKIQDLTDELMIERVKNRELQMDKLRDRKLESFPEETQALIRSLENERDLFKKNSELSKSDMQKLREDFHKIKLQYDEDLLQRQRQTADDYLKLEERVKDTIDKKDLTIKKLNSIISEMKIGGGGPNQSW